MRSASLLAIAVLVVVAVALPIQSASAGTLTLDIEPNPVVENQLLSFSGSETGSPLGTVVSIRVYANSVCVADGGIILSVSTPEISGSYFYQLNVIIGTGQFSARATSDVGSVSPCVTFTVVQLIQATINVNKVTTNGDTTTIFDFTVFRDGTKEFDNSIRMGDVWQMQFQYAPPIEITIQEIVPDGWYISDIKCEAGLQETTFELSGDEGVAIITFQASDTVACTFTNSPVGGAVGGVVMPANALAIVVPWLAVIGLVGCIGVVGVVTKRRR